MNITIEQLKDALTGMDAPYFKGELNLNLIGIRSSDRQANTFNDRLCVLYEQQNSEVLETYPITTDPGTYYRKNPINVDGTAVLAPGHYPRCWAIGVHRGQYTALVQRGLMTVYRDNNKDGLIDIDKVPKQTGYFGINMHYAAVSGYTLSVGKWSAGCQVFADKTDFDSVMRLVNKSAAKYGRFFSYTLINEEDL